MCENSWTNTPISAGNSDRTPNLCDYEENPKQSNVVAAYSSTLLHSIYSWDLQILIDNMLSPKLDNLKPVIAVYFQKQTNQEVLFDKVIAIASKNAAKVPSGKGKKYQAR